MRLYHLLSAEHALDDLRKRRLKISRIPDLNDPFELNAIRLISPEQRAVWRGFVHDVGERSGVICFSRSWSNPLLWSHYAEKHRGICLGFEVSNEITEPVRYRRSLLPFTLDLSQSQGGLGQAEMREILFTKYSGWRYENEVRVAVNLTDPESGHDPNVPLYFADFGNQMQLREVVVGVRSSVTRVLVEQALGNCAAGVAIVKARLAFKSFRVICNRKGFGNA